MKYPQTIKTVEEYKKMTSSDICKLLNADRSLAITEDKQGFRYIIKRYA